MKLWQTASIYVTTIFIFFIYKNEITDWMMNGQPSFFVIFLLALCFLLFPVVPFKVIIGMLGFMYGPFLGALISWFVALIGSVIMYLVVRTYFQKQGRAFLSKFHQVEKLQRMMEKSPFLAIFLARIVPVFPQSLVNIYPAFLNIRLLTYTVASALGKIPAMLVYSFLGNNLLSNWTNTLIIIGIYVLFLFIVYLIYRLWLKNKLV